MFVPRSWPSIEWVCLGRKNFLEPATPRAIDPRLRSSLRHASPPDSAAGGCLSLRCTSCWRRPAAGRHWRCSSVCGGGRAALHPTHQPTEHHPTHDARQRIRHTAERSDNRGERGGRTHTGQGRRADRPTEFEIYNRADHSTTMTMEWWLLHVCLPSVSQPTASVELLRREIWSVAIQLRTATLPFCTAS